MPELPEVQTIMDALAPRLIGRVITEVKVSCRQLRWLVPEDFRTLVGGATVIKLHRRGKYMLMELDNNKTIIWHLGMSGRLLHLPNLNNPPKHTHVILELDHADYLGLCDPRRFGLVAVTETVTLLQHQLLSGLGAEPLTNSLTPMLPWRFDAEYLHPRLQKRSQPIKQAILDQSLIAGVGNIYASESLYWAKLNPLTPARGLTLADTTRLVEAIVKVLQHAIEAGGSSLRDYVNPDGLIGNFQTQFAVYDRKGKSCPVCTQAQNPECRVLKITLGGRSTFFCQHLQR